MFDIGGWEVLIILLMALMVVKPQDIPSALASIARGIGRIRYEIDNWQQQMQFSLEQKREQHDTKEHDTTPDITPDATPDTTHETIEKERQARHDERA